MDLYELKEEEIDKLIKEGLNEAELEAYDCKTKVADILKGLDNDTEAIKKGINELKVLFAYEKKNDYFIKDAINSTNRRLKRAINGIYNLAIYSGSVSKNERRSITEEKIDFKQDGERLHITFPDLLPRRIRKDSPYKYSDIVQMYEPSFRRYFECGKHVIYSEKAAIIYTHYFESENEFVDHDNFETKIFTDLITSHMLLDDSPKYCAIFMDYRIGEKSHTEIDVIPYAKLKDFIV